MKNWIVIVAAMLMFAFVGAQNVVRMRQGDNLRRSNLRFERRMKDAGGKSKKMSLDTRRAFSAPKTDKEETARLFSAPAPKSDKPFDRAFSAPKADKDRTVDTKASKENDADRTVTAAKADKEKTRIFAKASLSV